MENTFLLAQPQNNRLRKILDLMTNVMPIGMIFNVSKKVDYFDLIVVLDRHCTYVSKSIDVLMEPALLRFSNCVYSLHTFSSVSQQIQGGNLFYCTVCVPENVIYKTEATTLQLPFNSQVFKQQVLSYHRAFEKEMEIGKQFLNGAVWYIERKILGLATFMLHQATELVYRSFLSALGDKVVRTHDLNKLRKYLQRFVPEILGVFDEDEMMETRLLSLLEKAYCDARYHALYQISFARVNKLLEGVKRLHERAIAAHNNQMFSWTGNLEIEL
ncbi:HEPN domain-containing protein [Pedobacter chitinilyticus]|uniref:HEPN domain-containing protein n=1 Tax=Pedobacter chitinilyticus TaxID=2233776 RepID=A0A3S3QF40_9SPHI|nr:HEPN domain-containing protein [Pedobacter chitinilyticus]RWU06358.1 HEPN domain-containing protein [Pedobacter chitinilyticus]